MLVLKSPARIIYDTATGSEVDADVSELRIISTLSNYYQAQMSDMDILTRLFGDNINDNHPVWVDFGQSSYWVCELKTKSA